MRNIKNKKFKLIRKCITLLFIVLYTFNSMAVVLSENDGSAFITKPEYDSMRNDFQERITSYYTGIDSLISNSIAAYLAGIQTTDKAEYSVDSRFAGETFNMINSDDLSIVENDRPFSICDIAIVRLGGWTGSNGYNTFSIYNWLIEGTPEGGRELLVSKIGNVNKLEGYYSDYKSYYNFTGYSMGGISLSGNTPQTLSTFTISNGNLYTPTSSYAFNTSSGYSVANVTTGVWRGVYSAQEKFNTFAFGNISFKAIGTNFGTANPVQTSGNVLYKANVLDTPYSGVYRLTTREKAYDAVAADSNLRGYRIGRESISTYTTAHPKYVEDLAESPTAVDYATTMTAGIKLFKAARNGKVKIKITMNDSTSLRVALSNKHFLTGFTGPTGRKLIPMNGKSYGSENFLTLTKDELEECTFSIQKGETYWFKWIDLTSEGKNTSITIPKTFEVTGGNS